MDEERGSLAVHSSLDAMFEVVAIDEYAGGASVYGDRLLSLPPRRGGRGGGAIELTDFAIVSVTFHSSFCVYNTSVTTVNGDRRLA